MKELAALSRVSAREKIAAKRRAKQQAKLSAKQKEKNTEMLVEKRGTILAYSTIIVFVLKMVTKKSPNLLTVQISNLFYIDP